MARRRLGRDFGKVFTFGGRVPASVGAILAAMVVATVASGMTGGALGAALALFPSRVAALEVWRLATWFLVTHPLTLLFAGFELWWVGQQLSYEWSELRFAARFLAIVLGTGILTFLVALVWPAADAPHTGPWPVANGVFLMWALLHPGAEVRLFGAIPLTGKLMAQIVVVGTVLWGLAEGGLAGIGRYVPHLSALAISWGLLRSRGRMRRTWLGVKESWFEWQLRRRTRHLRVVKKDGIDGHGPWVN